MTNLQDNREKTALIGLITAAFEGVSREDGVSLHEADVIDDYGSPEERAAARALDTESRWQDVPLDEITNHSSTLTFLDPKGFRYYAPAYMVWYLVYMDATDEIAYSSMSSNSLIYNLTADFGSEPTGYYAERFTLFTVPEAQAIARFLAYAAMWTEKENTEDRERVINDQCTSRDFTEEERKAFIEKERLLWAENGWLSNDAQQALDRYWGRFLPGS